MGPETPKSATALLDRVSLPETLATIASVQSSPPRSPGVAIRELECRTTIDRSGFQGPKQVEWDELGRNQAAVTRGRDEEQ